MVSTFQTPERDLTRVSSLAMEPLVIAFHSCKDITVIWRLGVQHKMCLYADDPLFFLSNPDTDMDSFPAINEIYIKLTFPQ